MMIGFIIGCDCISCSSRYDAIITLNQTILRVKEEKVAAQLLDIYFGLFLVLLNVVFPLGSRLALVGRLQKYEEQSKVDVQQLSSHLLYYAIITLNQTILRVKEEKVAAQLLDIYFGLFLVQVGTALPPLP
jgi:UDP-3-O-acyl-N-acetylglucosamine deacetylase